METQIAIETSAIIRASAEIDREQSLVTSVDGSILQLKIESLCSGALRIHFHILCPPWLWLDGKFSYDLPGSCISN